jgi:hypothetical protein
MSKQIKYKKSPEDIMFIRANPDLVSTKCKNCGKEVYKNNGHQIVFFCGKPCRKEHKHRYGFRIIEEGE